MWCFQPMPEPEFYATAVTWQSVPLGNAASKPDYPYLSINMAKRFMLYRSLFDLVNSVYCLGLEDKKLQAWYFGLSNEDRKIIQDEGGLFQFLLNHPALEVVKQAGMVHVKPQIRRTAEEIAANMNKSRVSAFHGVSQCKKCGTSCPLGSERCRICIVPSPVVEERMCLGQKGESTAIQRNLSEKTNMLSITTSALKDKPQASLSVDTGLEHSTKMAQGSSHPAYPVRKAQFGMVRDNRSYVDLQEETPPEYCSFNSSSSTQQASVDSLFGANIECTENKAGLFSSENSVARRKRPSEWSKLDTTADDSLQNKTKDMSVNSELWLNCSVTQEKPNASPSQRPYVDLPVKLGTEKSQQTIWKKEQSVAESFMSVSPDKSAVQLPISAAPATVNQMVDASGDFRASFTSTQECAAAPSTLHASTEIHLPLCCNQDTQTSQVSTADKCVITEVYIADLDYLTKEFLRLQSVEKELEQMKANLLKPSMKCECGEKLKQAELKLLALQYSMCQDHCWRRYYTSAQGERQLHCPGRVPESLAETLQALEQDYSQLRRQVLSGAPLDELTPLSVDTQRLNTEARYTPAQNEYLEEKAPSELTVSSQIKNDTEDEQIHLTEEVKIPPQKQKDALRENAVPQPRPVSVNSSTVVSVKNESSRPGGSEEGGNVTSEAWYDAEEDLGTGGQTLTEELLRKAMESKTDGKIGDGDGVSSSCNLCITHLHQDVTEEDLLLAFKKYHPRHVSFTVSNKLRSANMTVSSPENAEMAVHEFSGTLIHGQPIQVRHVGRPPAAAGPEGDLTFKKPQATSAAKPAPSGTTPKSGSVKKYTPYNMSPKPLRCRIEKLLNVSDVPTATGTYVPQQQPPATTATFTFGMLMRHLSERHPLLGRGKILEALLELRAQHGGSLNCLTLDTIVEMTSEHITAQAPGPD